MEDNNVGDVNDIEQEADRDEIPYMPSVPVAVDGPVQVHQVPSVSSGVRNFTGVTATEAVRVANADPRRRSLTIISVGQNMYVGNDKVNVEGGTHAALWPANVPLVITHSDWVWVKSATSTTVVSVLSENWAN